jgi:selenoprotein W-related protein
VVDLIKTFEPQIESVTLVPSDGGRFELTVNGDLLYSKLRTGRHAAPGEAVDLVKKYLKEAR